MRLFEYVCRCGKRFESQFQQTRHAKYECTMKHVPVESTGKSIRILSSEERKAKP